MERVKICRNPVIIALLCMPSLAAQAAAPARSACEGLGRSERSTLNSIYSVYSVFNRRLAQSARIAELIGVEASEARALNPDFIRSSGLTEAMHRFDSIAPVLLAECARIREEPKAEIDAPPASGVARQELSKLCGVDAQNRSWGHIDLNGEVSATPRIRSDVYSDNAVSAKLAANETAKLDELCMGFSRSSGLEDSIEHLYLCAAALSSHPELSRMTPETSRCIAERSSERARSIAGEKSELPAKISAAINEILGRSGKVQLKEVLKIMAEEREAAEKASIDWGDYLNRWTERELKNMQTHEMYPTLERLLALMAARTPSFGADLSKYLYDVGTIRIRTLNYLRGGDDEPTGVKFSGTKAAIKGGKVESRGAHLFNAIKTVISMPERSPHTVDDLSYLTVEVHSHVLRALVPQPGFYNLWLKAVRSGDIAKPSTWRPHKKFAGDLQAGYYRLCRKLLNESAIEAFGRPRPDVAEDFVRRGPGSLLERLAKVGMTPENEEASFALLFYMKPVMDALLLWSTLYAADQAYDAWTLLKYRDEGNLGFEAKVKAGQEQIREGLQKNEPQIAKLQEQILILSEQREEIAREIKEGKSKLPKEDLSLREQTVEDLNEKIAQKQYQVKTLKRQQTEVAPF